MIEGLLAIQAKHGDIVLDDEDLHTKLFGESRPWKKVWKIDREYKTWDCAMCNGKGVVNAKINELNTAVRCPSCNGKGTKSMPVHYPINVSINHLDYKLDRNGKVNVRAYIHPGTYVDLSRIYTSEEDCIEAIKNDPDKELKKGF